MLALLHGENIQEFTLAQGFDNFYSRGNIDPNATGSVWGADDEYLYDAIFWNRLMMIK